VNAAAGSWETWSWDDSLFAGAAGYYEQGRLPYAPGLPEAFARSLALDGRGRLLDVGCGPGTVTLRLAPLFEAVVGLDPDAEMLARASRAAAIEADLRAKEAMGEALAGTGKPFVGVSGTLALALGGVVGTGTEADTAGTGPQADGENAVIALAGRGIRSSVVRLPPTVHSSLDHRGYVPALIGIARANGRAGYAGAGSNRWPAVHTLDAARLFRLAVEGAPAGSRLHAVADEGVPFREIAGAIGRHLGVPTVSIPPEEAEGYFGFLAMFVSLDNPASSALTRELLDWRPEHPGLLDDLGQGHYYQPES
jgi:SAM-dependent methyltransferase